MILDYITLGFVGYYLLSQFLLKDLRFTLGNPVFYLFVWSFIYLLVPAMISPAFTLGSFSASVDSIQKAKYFSIYYVFIFIFFYILSKKSHKKSLEIKATPKVILQFISFISLILFIYVLMIFVINVIPLSISYSNRVKVAELYSSIFHQYKLGLITNILLVFCIIRAINYKKLFYFIYILPCVFLELASNGKSESMRIAIVIIIVAVIIGIKISRLKVVIFALGLLSTGLVRSGGSLFGIIQLLGEFFVTYFSGVQTVENLSGRGSSFTYLFYGLLSFFPNSIRSKLLELTNDHVVDIVAFSGFDFQIMNNPIGEGFYYNGGFFVYVLPIIIGVYYYILTILLRSRNIFILLLVVMSTQYMQTAFRIGLIRNMFIFFPFIIIYFIWMWFLQVYIKVTSHKLTGDSQL